ncbi:glycosyltransferase family 2 protein [Bacillus inaquosorum]|uniref:glycosyltransferase family 2 protein n=1 Tax=Bacillus inaquosorum TaxID=483913 RepID=UPI002281FAFA|nr:glycosyltransferase family 2 protein [Bacillus inaquosorum]MCY7963627.1 glycosyltransferase [Bacillus inaquosorum]MCY8494992.1 glycosyltransferase [Bacillus inaquosorum]MCY8695797.1 glycosyltransferase [Bacillus inaquosorum]
MKHKISVIIPVYNQINYITQCLNSLINQTIGFDNLQIICVDDCSTDGTRDILKEHELIHDNIEVIYLKENSGGPSKPKNIGAKKAEGKYIIFLDPDDALPQDAYERLFNVAEKYQSDFVMGSMMRFNENKYWKVSQFETPLLKRYHYNINIKSNPEFLSVLGYMVNKLIRTSFYQKNKFEFSSLLKLNEDFVLSNQLIERAAKFTYIPEIVYYYRTLLQDSLTNLHPRQAIENFYESNKLLEDFFKKGKFAHLLPYSIKQNALAIIYRFNEEFSNMGYTEKIKALNLAKEIFNKVPDHLLSNFKEFDKRLILLARTADVHVLLDYIENKIKRDIEFEKYSLNRNIQKKTRNILKSRSYRYTRFLRLLNKINITKGKSLYGIFKRFKYNHNNI